MFYKTPLIYINANIDKENNLVMIEQVNSYKYLSVNFFREIKKRRRMLEDKLEIFCILGNKEEIEIIQEDILGRIRKFFEKIQEDNIEYLIENLQKEVENTENSINQRFFDLYISTIIENEKLKYPMMNVMQNSNGVFCLGLYLTNSPQEEKAEEVDSSMITYLQKEKPFFMGQQIMIQSFLLEDAKNRKILAIVPNENNEWYALLEGGIKLYLSTDNPYQREKISSNDVGIWTNLEIYSIINNPMYAYKKFFSPYELFEEWNNAFLYALAVLQVEYETEKLELLYIDFLEFIEKNICYTQETNKEIFSKEQFIKALIISIKRVRGYLKGEDEPGISKNIIILLKSRCCYLPTLFKIIEKHYPEKVWQRLDYLTFFNTEWKELLELVQKAENNYDKGIALENVAGYFIDCINGLQVTDRRLRTDNEEIDLVCCNLYNNSELWKLGPVILIECKNWEKNIDTKEIRNLAYIMDKKGISTFLLFVKNDVTEGAKHEIIKQAAHNKFILVLNLQDLNQVDNKKIEPIDLINIKWQQLEEEISNIMENLM